MDFEDQEADDHEEPEPISISAEHATFNHHHESNDVFPSTAADPHAPPHRRPKFKECLKNHAVGIGGHAVDGCGEFMPAGEDGTLESLRCAACGCHRNFHRKETTSPHGGPYGPPHQQLLLTHHPPHGGHQGHFGYRSPSGYLQVAAPQPQRAAAPLALPSSSGGGGGDEMGEEIYYSTPPGSSGSGKKRFRTKFTQEQKDKMLQLALRLDWKIQKQDEEIVQSFCEEFGIKRHVLKVWMHNNKHTLGKKT